MGRGGGGCKLQASFTNLYPTDINRYLNQIHYCLVDLAEAAWLSG